MVTQEECPGDDCGFGELTHLLNHCATRPWSVYTPQLFLSSFFFKQVHRNFLTAGIFSLPCILMEGDLRFLKIKL